MKKFIVAFFLLLSINYSQNLLPNPGFENWSGGLPLNWFNDDSILIYQEDVVVHSGYFSVKESLITTTQERADFTSAKFAVTPNTQYTFSIWVYDNDPAGRVRQAIAWRVGGTWSNVWSNTYSGNSDQWQQLTMTAIAPNGADSAYVFIRAYDSLAAWDGGAVFYLDDASFTPPATQAPVILRVWHRATNPPGGTPVWVYAQVTDDGTIAADTLYYGINNLNNPIKIAHSNISNDTFQFLIPGQAAGDTVFYYLKFTDDDNLSTISDTYSFYVGRFALWINEVYYDAPGTDSGCFIELFGNPGTSLNGFTLVGVNGTGGLPYATINLSGYSIPNDGFFVIAQNPWVPNVDLVDPNADLQNGPDNLELRFNNITIDALGYGTLNGWIFTGEWLPAIDVNPGHSLGRYPDGDDTDNNSVDFNDYDTLTPGTPNPVVGIEEKKPKPIVPLILRNPVFPQMKLSEIIRINSGAPVFVYDVTGQLVKKMENVNEQIDLRPGVYFLRMRQEPFSVHKIVVAD
ncbi:MAG: carbohydrate binding domain-containing protein [candidate division WOR-3 bacterium]